MFPRKQKATHLIIQVQFKRLERITRFLSLTLFDLFVEFPSYLFRHLRFFKR